MADKSKPIIFVQFIVLMALVVGLSIASVQLWGGKAEQIPEDIKLSFAPDMTIGQFGKANDLANPVLKAVFGLESKKDLEKPLDKSGMTNEQIEKKVMGSLALAAEHESKDWIKILVKFAAWIAFLVLAFFMMRRGLIGPASRKWLYISSVFIFGIVLGSDPSAMGTVKDAIVLFASKGVIFPPRMIALTVFLLMVLVFNKSICSWGCQAGVLQDLVFRLNRNRKDTKGILPQYKPSFAVTNTFRVLFFTLFTAAAVIWGLDLFEYIDPFKIFKPAALGAFGIAFVAVLLTSSLLVYRPWCHLFCPFGLVGWLVEKVSIFKIKVNYDTCIACEACSAACPSTVMDGILKRERTIPDCFSCANCIDVCPTDSVSLAAGKRDLPSENKFTKGP